jgi:hypothetical protein
MNCAEICHHFECLYAKLEVSEPNFSLLVLFHASRRIAVTAAIQCVSVCELRSQAYLRDHRVITSISSFLRSGVQWRPKLRASHCMHSHITNCLPQYWRYTCIIRSNLEREGPLHPRQVSRAYDGIGSQLQMCICVHFALFPRRTRRRHHIVSVQLLHHQDITDEAIDELVLTETLEFPSASERTT